MKPILSTVLLPMIPPPSQIQDTRTFFLETKIQIVAANAVFYSINVWSFGRLSSLCAPTDHFCPDMLALGKPGNCSSNAARWHLKTTGFKEHLWQTSFHYSYKGKYYGFNLTLSSGVYKGQFNPSVKSKLWLSQEKIEFQTFSLFNLHQFTSEIFQWNMEVENPYTISVINMEDNQSGNLLM